MSTSSWVNGDDSGAVKTIKPTSPYTNPCPGTTSRPSFPGTRVVTVPSPLGSITAGPANGVESVLPVVKLV